MKRDEDGGLHCEPGEYAHSGDLGDLIHGLAALKALGGGHVILCDTPGKTTHGMTRDRAAALRPLLEAQPYVWSVRHVPETVHGSAWDGFRDHLRYWRTLGGAHLGTYGLNDHALLAEPWLVARRPVLPIDRLPMVVVHRSERYHNPDFPWREVVDLARVLHGEVVAVGTTREVNGLRDAVGWKIPHVPTQDLLELAELLAGASAFVGNQSAPLAIAEGLKMPAIVEGFRPLANCDYGRGDALALYEGDSPDWRKIEWILRGSRLKTLQIYGRPRSGTNAMEVAGNRHQDIRALGYASIDKHTERPAKVADGHVAMVKHPGAWLVSMRRAGWASEGPVALILEWMRCFLRVKTFCARPENRAIWVPHDHLLTRLPAVQAAVTHLLGVATGPRWTLPDGATDRDGHGTAAPWDASYYLERRWQEEMTEDERRAVAQAVPTETLWEVDNASGYAHEIP